jgi:NodT family efflux transporter outer membrane factor (OMF) lipoprotein
MEALPETTVVPGAFISQEGEGFALPANWIEGFNDPQLSQIIAEALENNLNLRATASQLEESAAYVTQASSQMKPVVAASGQGTQQGFEGGSSSRSSEGALSVSWELDIWGKIRAQTKAAEADFAAATADYEFARLSLKAQVAKSWFTAVETRKQLEFAREVVVLFGETLEIVESKYEFGDIGMQEVHLARADLASAKERLRQVEGAHKIAKRGLEVLLGRYPSAEMEVADEFVAVPPPIPAGLPSELIERRPDLVAAERRVAATFNLTTAAKAARLPSVGITSAVGGANSQLTDLMGSGSGFWSVGANFLAPIYTGGALKAEVKIANARQEAALSRYGQQALVAFSEVENALSNESLLREREQLLQKVVEDNRGSVEIAQLQFKNGAVELLNVLQMQGRLINAEIALISLRNARLAERINLHLALGGDFIEQ